MGDNATETLQSRFEVWLSLESIAIADQMLSPLGSGIGSDFAVMEI
jgi:hypothetical protein